MQSTGREPSMEDILASIKKVIAEEKEMRTAVPPVQTVSDTPLPDASAPDFELDDEVLELNDPLAPPADLEPPLVDEQVAGHSRQSLDQLSTIAATVPVTPAVNPLEEMVREMLKPILKQWLDEHLPKVVDEHVKREISRITGRPL